MILTFLLFYNFLTTTFCVSVAQQKCIEYSKSVYQFQESLALTLKSTPKKVDTCGIISTPLIVGGTESREKEFPHMAVIGYGKTANSKMKWNCGGTLIAEKHVVTAAHCSNSKDGEPRKVRLGAVDLNESPHYMQEIIVDHFIPHPRYKKPSAYNDIALIYLARPAQFSAYVRPACLNTLEHLQSKYVGAIGFGKLDQFDRTGNPKLMKVDLEIIEQDVCRKYVVDKGSLPRGLQDIMICAGNLKDGGKDTCQGDSGGPLHVALKEPYCMYSIVGLTSFGKTCGLEYSPGVYTRISSFVPWIERMVWGDDPYQQ